MEQRLSNYLESTIAKSVVKSSPEHQRRLSGTPAAGDLSIIKKSFLRSVFFLTDTTSARGFSGLGPGIDKRTFGSCSYIYLVSRKNKRFFRKSADYLRLVKDRPGGIFL